MKDLSYSSPGKILPVPDYPTVLLLYAKGSKILSSPHLPLAPDFSCGSGSSIMKCWQSLMTARWWEPAQEVNRISRGGLCISWEWIWSCLLLAELTGKRASETLCLASPGRTRSLTRLPRGCHSPSPPQLHSRTAPWLQRVNLLRTAGVGADASH